MKSCFTVPWGEIKRLKKVDNRKVLEVRKPGIFYPLYWFLRQHAVFKSWYIDNLLYLRHSPLKIQINRGTISKGKHRKVKSCLCPQHQKHHNIKEVMNHRTSLLSIVGGTRSISVQTTTSTSLLLSSASLWLQRWSTVSIQNATPSTLFLEKRYINRWVFNNSKIKKYTNTLVPKCI